MDILARIELKIDALMKCWAVKDGESERTLFDVVSGLIKQQDSKETKEKTVEELYKESKEKPDYQETLQSIIMRYFEKGLKVICDEHGYFIENERVYNIKDNGV
jgi:hypothetical protein